MKLGKRDLVAACGGSITEADFARRLNTSQKEVQRHADQGELLRLKVDKNEYVYPAWQIYENEILDGLAAVMMALGDSSVWSKQIFFTTYSDYLEGELSSSLGTNYITPVQALRAGYKETVIDGLKNGMW